MGGGAGGGFEGEGFGVAEDYEDFLGHFGDCLVLLGMDGRNELLLIDWWV